MPRQGPSATPRSGSTQRPGVLGAVARFWQRSYAADYLGFAMLLTAYMTIQFFIEPFHRMFSLDNRAIQYPHADIERVPAYMNIIYAGVGPLGFLLVWAIILQPGVHKAHVTIIGLLISLVLASFITDVVKNTVGRPRPDLIARCKPEKGTPEHTLVTIDVCTETGHHILHDGWRSFPSGHSSFAFSGLGYLALFLAGQLHVFRPRTDLARVLIALAPLLGALLIAVSRLEDYRHDVYDVTCGSILGISVAYFSYRRYYPSLRTKNCDVPYPSRAESLSVNGFAKVKDEEERVGDALEFTLDDLGEEEESYPLNELGSRDGS